MKLIRFEDNVRGELGILLPDGRRLNASGEFNDCDEGFFAVGDFVECGVAGRGELAPRVGASHGS